MFQTLCFHLPDVKTKYSDPNGSKCKRHISKISVSETSFPVIQSLHNLRAKPVLRATHDP